MSQFRAQQVGAAIAIAERARNESGAALVQEEENEERKEGGFFTRRRRLTSPSFTEDGTRDEEQTSSSTIRVKNHKQPGTMRTLTFRSAKTAKAD